MHWELRKPFLALPWDRPLPNLRQWLSLIVWGLIFFMAFRPYVRFAAQRGWPSTTAKLAQDLIRDCRGAYRDGRNHTIRRYFEQ
jgi:hypothetical protein